MKWNIDHSPALWHFAAGLPTRKENICSRKKFFSSVYDNGDSWNEGAMNFFNPGATISLGK